MTAVDVEGNPLHEGDVVHCVEEGAGTILKEGKTYTVAKVKPSSRKVWLVESNFWFSSDRFRKGIGPDTDLVERRADRIMALINGRPWSPTREEILEILRS